LSVVEFLPHQYYTIKDEFLKACAAGSGDEFLKERQEAVSALIDHGDRVSEFLEELQERKEQERMRLREIRKLQYVYRLLFEIDHLNQHAPFAGLMRALWI
jgi:hypothetical protein